MGQDECFIREKKKTKLVDNDKNFKMDKVVACTAER